MLSGAAIGTVAQTPPAKGQAAKMPESYQNFFPSQLQQRGPLTQGQAVELVKGAKANKFIPRPHLAGAPLRAAAQTATESNIFGYLYFFQGSELEQGMYRINPASGATYMWTDQYTDWAMTMTAGWLRDGKLCGLNSMQFMGGIYAYGQIELDLITGELLGFQQLRFDGEDLVNQYVTVAYRDLDGRVYGYGYDPEGTGYGFNTADASNIDTSEMIIDVPSTEVCTSLCYNVQDDMFYGVNMQGKFVCVDTEGNQEELFDLGIADYRATVTGITYSPKDGKYIWNAYLKDGSSAMYAIDPEEQTATKLYDCPYGEEYIYMVCSDDNTLPTAPAKPVLDSYSFEGDALNGQATYTMPGRTAEGNPLAGQLDWRFFVDGNETLTGTAAAGSKVNVNIAEVYNGTHTFAMSVGKDGEYSAPVTFTKWIGSDYPVAPEDITLTETKLTWKPVTEGTHNGYIDASAVKYIVYLNDVKIAETNATECDVEMPQGKPFTSYTAQVIATADGKQSEPGLSNYITYGDALEINGKLYYRPEEEEFELFKAIDLDGKTTADGEVRNWQFSTYMGFPSFMSGADGEDLLIFPPINFTKTDKAYSFSMEAGLRLHTDTRNTIEVWIGKEPTFEGMTQRIMAPYAPQNMLADVLTEYFAVNEPGTYYIGILTKTDAVGIHISELTVAETDRDADVPQNVQDLNVIPDATGALTATVEFTMPSKTANGKDIASDATLTANVVSREFVINHPEQGEVTATKTVTGAPGSKQSVEIETLQNDNTIGVTCTLDGRSGSEATASVFTGVVKPYTVQNLKATISSDNMDVTLTWTPPVSSGDENGPIGDTFYYSLWYYADGWEFLQGIGWDELSTVVGLDPGAPQNYYNLGIMAMNAAGQSDYIASQTVVIGTPYTLPLDETFPNYEETYWPITMQRPSSEYNGTYWMVDDPTEVSPIFANETGVAYIGFIGDEGLRSAYSRVALPKFSTKNVEDVKFTLNYWGGPFEATFFLWGNTYGIDELEYIGDFPTGDGWIKHTLAIPDALLGNDWVELLLDSEFNSDNDFAMFCGYSISGVSGIEGVDADGQGRIFTSPGMLHVAGFSGQPLTVTDLSGRTVVSVPALEDMAGFALRPGIYVVKAGATARKIAVK